MTSWMPPCCRPTAGRISLPRILDTLEALGRARREGDGWRG